MHVFGLLGGELSGEHSRRHNRVNMLPPQRVEGIKAIYVVNDTVGFFVCVFVCVAGESSEGGSGDKACWRIGLKVAWDIHTPGLMLPLESGDCYYMRGTEHSPKAYVRRCACVHI